MNREYFISFPRMSNNGTWLLSKSKQNKLKPDKYTGAGLSFLVSLFRVNLIEIRCLLYLFFSGDSLTSITSRMGSR